MSVKNVVHKGEVIAKIFFKQPLDPGVHFYVENDRSLQVGKQLRVKGELITPHRHHPVKIQRQETLQEVLYVESGKVKITFYDEAWQAVDSCVLNAGDMILLISGGHGFEMLEETVMIEIKQGPYDPGATQKRG